MKSDLRGSVTKRHRGNSGKIAFLAFCGGKDAKRVELLETDLARAGKDGAKLLIVPEASLDATGPFSAASVIDARLSRAVRAAGVGLVVGRVEKNGDDDDFHYRLRADVLDESGKCTFSYYKHADPSYSTSSDFQSAFDFAGSHRAEFPVANIAGMRIGILICHDIIYPALAEQYAGRIDLLVTLSGVSNNVQLVDVYCGAGPRARGAGHAHMRSFARSQGARLNRPGVA